MKQNKTYLVAGIIAVIVVLGGGFFLYKTFRYSRVPESDLFSAGQVAAYKGNHLQAIEYYQALLKKDPRHSTAMEFMSKSQYQLHDYKGAIKSMEESLKISPTTRGKAFLSFLYDKAGLKELAVALSKEVAAESKKGEEAQEESDDSKSKSKKSEKKEKHKSKEKKQKDSQKEEQVEAKADTKSESKAEETADSESDSKSKKSEKKRKHKSKEKKASDEQAESKSEPDTKVDTNSDAKTDSN